MSTQSQPLVRSSSDPTSGIGPGPLGDTSSIVSTAQTAAQQNPGGIKGLFSQIGQTLHAAAPQLEEIGARLAQAGGNPGPAQMLQQKRQMAFQQQELSERQQTDALHRQLLQQQISQGAQSFETPEQKQARAVETQRQELENTRKASPPTDIVAPNDQGQYQHYQREYAGNGEYKTTPTTVPGTPVSNPTQGTSQQSLLPGAQGPMPPVGPLLPPSAIGNVLKPAETTTPQRPLLAMPKLTHGQPVADGKGGYIVPVYNSMQQIDHYEPLQGQPLSTLSTNKSGFTTQLKDDGSGHMVPVQLPSSTTTTKGGGAGGGGAAPTANVGAPVLNSPLSGPTKTMTEAAPHVIDLANRVLQEVDQQQKQLGPAASRWNEFMAGKVGAPNPQFTQLRTDAALLQTLLMRMHVGARGSGEIMAHFKNLMDTGIQSPENLRAAVGEVIRYAQDLSKPRQQPGAVNPDAGGATHRYNPATGQIESIQ